MSSVGLLHIDEIIQKCDDTLENLSSIGMSPNSEKKMERLFSATEVADMVGRSRNSIHRLSEKDWALIRKKMKELVVC